MEGEQPHKSILGRLTEWLIGKPVDPKEIDQQPWQLEGPTRIPEVDREMPEHFTRVHPQAPNIFQTVGPDGASGSEKAGLPDEATKDTLRLILQGRKQRQEKK